MNDRAALIVVARMDSSRLPGKALRQLGDRPVIGHVLQRARNVRNADALVFATTSRAVDDPLARYAASLGVEVHRGHTENVARRILDAAGQESGIIARINGDSPFLDPELIRQGIERCREHCLDFVTNIPGRTFPYGIAVEIFRAEALQRLLACCDAPEDLEHVTPCLYRSMDQLRAQTMSSANPEYAAARLVVDTEEDLRMCQRICDAFEGDVTRRGYEAVAAAYLTLSLQ